jgi:DNA-binding MurR/RpiR family transcriptional regulator
MCKTAGFRGFHELKLKLVSDLAVNRSQPLSHATGLTTATEPKELIARVMQLSADAIETATTTVDPSSFARAVTSLAGARRILVIGNGTSMAPAQDAAYRLSALGLHAVAPADSYSQGIVARQLTRGDVCLMISHTGATTDSLHPAMAASDAGAFVVAISSYDQSPASEIADVLLVAGGHEQGFRLETMASRLSHLAVVDALFVGIALTEPRRATKYLDAMAEVTAEHSY